MCAAVTCRQCGRTTWAGCGQHVDDVMRGVAKADRCPGHDGATGNGAKGNDVRGNSAKGNAPSGDGAAGGAAPSGFLARLFGR
ncbi:hypothetical protein CLV28_1212 [Sediminihabitans luteus]|uniref:Uncharacterized protein n=1 Tax=Sediminihabitans luteus TaxID=1138585 RepID=A0A2M9D1D0_9CELL|nr:hypothetical protein CLV28_1212 [Sediminihabitans luteus]GIJ00613.1 hypothetical protein Slu03_29900 [Sediminihabitans luteus]